MRICLWNLTRNKFSPSTWILSSFSLSSSSNTGTLVGPSNSAIPSSAEFVCWWFVVFLSLFVKHVSSVIVLRSITSWPCALPSGLTWFLCSCCFLSCIKQMSPSSKNNGIVHFIFVLRLQWPLYVRPQDRVAPIQCQLFRAVFNSVRKLFGVCFNVFAFGARRLAFNKISAFSGRTSP